MADEPPPPEPIDDKEAERRFNETLGRLVNTPHIPHKPKTAPGPAESRCIHCGRIFGLADGQVSGGVSLCFSCLDRD